MTEFWSLPTSAAATPDTRSPARFLRWIVRQQGPVVWVALLLGVVWQLPLIVGPWLFGRAIDAGILPGDAPRRRWLRRPDAAR